MEVYLFVVVLVKENGKKRLVYKDDGRPACYTTSEKAKRFAKKMKERYPYAVGDYSVENKVVVLEDIS